MSIVVKKCFNFNLAIPVSCVADKTQKWTCSHTTCSFNLDFLKSFSLYEILLGYKFLEHDSKNFGRYSRKTNFFHFLNQKKCHTIFEHDQNINLTVIYIR